MISIQTFLSAFNEKGTLLKWLKKLEKNYENAALAYVQVVPVDSSHIKLKFIFADETELLSDSLPVGGGGSGVITRQDIINANGLVTPLSQSGTQLVGTTVSSMGIIQTPVRAGDNISIVMDSQGYKIKANCLPIPTRQSTRGAYQAMLQNTYNRESEQATLDETSFKVFYTLGDECFIHSYNRFIIFKDTLSLNDFPLSWKDFVVPAIDKNYWTITKVTEENHNVLYYNHLTEESLKVYDEITGWVSPKYKRILLSPRIGGYSDDVIDWMEANTEVYIL